VQGFLVNAIMAFVIAIGITVIMSPLVIPFLTRLKVGQHIRDDGPQTHLHKNGTPTMGGVILITAVMVASFLMAGASAEVLAALLIMLAFGGIGFWDDYIKVVLKRSLGLRAREKLILQLVIGILYSLLLLLYFEHGTELIMPFTGRVIDISFFYVPLLIVLLMGTANGVNLTDGLDGLASGVTFLVALTWALICIMTGHYNLAIFCGALAGGCLGFLVFNRHPARVFMGDTGSMALGGAVAAIATLTNSEIALIIIGGVYVIESLSVLLQIFSYQIFRRRIFLMAPLHHHFELKGWKETKVVHTFYLLAAAVCLIGIFSYRGIG
jgi:phospho-N-acetylmuramoyl-pentapeptide-transferase